MTLEASDLFEPTLPLSYGWALQILSELDQLKADTATPKAQRRARATALYAELNAKLSLLHEPTPTAHTHDSPDFRAWYAEAVMLWVRFARTGSVPLVDSVGALTLKEFPVDLPLDASVADAVKQALGRAFAFSADELDAVERRVAHATSNLELKRLLTQELASQLAERGGGAEARLALMCELYGPLPFRPGDVDLLLVSSAVFFFVPRKGSALEVPDWAERPPAEQQAVRAFFEKLDLANTAETRRFPAFGLYEPELFSSSLVEKLARRANASEPVVKATLATMFSLIPRSLHAQYLVHDLWGHTWQEALNEFEWEYALLPQLDRALTPHDGPEFGGDGAPTLASAFWNEGGTTRLSEERLLAFAEADLRGRIQVATSVPLSEVFADFMEAKFSRARPQLELPTSSLIASTSLKIDLTIADARAQVRRYTRPYRKLAVDAETQARLAEQLTELGLPTPGLAEAVARAGRAMWLSFAPAFDESLLPEPVELHTGRLRSSVLRRLVLQLALVMADLERALGRPAAADAELERWRDPGTCADLFAVTLTHFYEQDRRRNFWHLDQLARNELGPACQLLRAALTRDSQRPPELT
jgi:hypothetical protein